MQSDQEMYYSILEYEAAQGLVEPLSERERWILVDAIYNGLSNLELAKKHSISLATAKGYKSSIFQKLQQPSIQGVFSSFLKFRDKLLLTKTPPIPNHPLRTPEEKNHHADYLIETLTRRGDFELAMQVSRLKGNYERVSFEEFKASMIRKLITNWKRTLEDMEASRKLREKIDKGMRDTQ